MPVLELVSAAYKGYKVGMKVGERLNVKETHRDVANWVSRYDYVWFDFSDWASSDLNSTTTSYVFGIPSGKLKIKADGEVWELNCNSTLVGSDVVYLYKWCRANAPSVGDSQRRFRFEDGKYAGEGEVKTKYKAMGIAAVAVGILGALMSD